MGEAVFPSCSLASFKRTYASTPCSFQDYCIQCPNPVADRSQPTPLPETPGHPQACLAQSLVGSLLLSLRSWCAQGFVCALQESVSQVLWKFCNQIPLASEVKFPGGSQSLCPIPRLGNLLRVLELSQQCKNIFGIIVLQFMSRLLGGSMVGLMVTSSKRTCATHCASQVCCSQSPCPQGRTLLTLASPGDTQTTKAGLTQSLWGPWVLVCTRFYLSPPSISGEYGV